MIVVRIETEPTIRPGTPEVLFEDIYARGGGTNYDVSADGESFLMVSRNPTATEVILVQNWAISGFPN